MNKLQLHLITFEYLDYKCFLPRIINDDCLNKYHKSDFFEKIITELKKNENVKKIDVQLCLIGSFDDLHNELLSNIKAPNPSMKFLKIEDRLLYDKKFIPELDEKLYTKMLINELHFPVRVMDKQTGLDTYEAFLPIIVIDEISLE